MQPDNALALAIGRGGAARAVGGGETILRRPVWRETIAPGARACFASPERRIGRPAPARRRPGLAPVFATGWRLAKKDDESGPAAAEIAEVRAIADGDQEAFARLIDRESPRLLRFAQSILDSLDEAEDVVQETLVRLWETAELWRPEARIGTWLHAVCYNRCIDRLRRRRDFVDPSALDEMPDEQILPEGAMLRLEAVRDVRAAVGRLPHRQRTAVLLFHFQEMPQSAAARVMGVSESAFESLLSRARRQMRAWLAAQGDDDE